MTNPLPLSAADLRSFKAFGFLVLRQVLNRDELRTMDGEFCAAMAAQHATPFDGTQRRNAGLLGQDTPFFSSLLDDPRLLNVARQLMGEDILGICVDGNRYVGDTSWHPDHTSNLLPGLKFAIYLQSVRGANGALRVVPGSHLSCPWTDEFSQGMWNTPIAQVPAFVLDSDPGDVVVFDTRLWHGSSGGSADRRMSTVVYYANPASPEAVAAFQRQGELIIESLRLAGAAQHWLYPASWLAQPQMSLTRRRWIERLTEIGFLTTPGLIEPPLATAR